MFTLIGKTNIDFVGKRYIGFALSAALMLLGIYGIFRIGSNRAKVAIDFSGGTSMQVRLEKVEAVENLRAALKADFPDAEIQQIAGKPEYLIRLRNKDQETGKTGVRLTEDLGKFLPGNKVVDTASEEVGPAVSAKLRSQAIMAFFIGMLFITIYIAFRFDLRFAVGAFVATVHDV